MRKLISILFVLQCLNAISQDYNSIIKLTESNIDSNLLELVYLPDSLQQYSCEGLIYYDTNDIVKLEKGCGDGSLEMSRQHFYFINGETIYIIAERFYYNAPPTFTKEVAMKEGIVSGWFDPSKTKSSKYICIFKNGDMIKMINDDQKEVNPNTDNFKKTATVFNQEIKEALIHYLLISKKQIKWKKKS